MPLDPDRHEAGSSPLQGSAHWWVQVLPVPSTAVPFYCPFPLPSDVLMNKQTSIVWMGKEKLSRVSCRGDRLFPLPILGSFCGVLQMRLTKIRSTQEQSLLICVAYMWEKLCGSYSQGWLHPGGSYNILGKQ